MIENASKERRQRTKSPKLKERKNGTNKTVAAASGDKLLSHEEQRLAEESRVMVNCLTEFKEKAKEVQDKIDFMSRKIDEESDCVVSEGVSYLVMKQQMLLSYCINIGIYLGLKLKGESIENHGASLQLLELRTALEKMRPLDSRLKYQLDKLYRAAFSPAIVHPDAQAADPLSYRPNVDALMDTDEDNATLSKGDKLSDLKYRAPKFAAVPYDEDANQRLQRKLQRNNEIAKRGEIVDAIRHEFGDQPEVVTYSHQGVVNETNRRRLDHEEKERTQYEEDRMIRLPRSKKQRGERHRQINASTRLDTIADVGRIDQFMKVPKAAERSHGQAKKRMKTKPAHGPLRLALGAVGKKAKKNSNIL